MGTPLHAQGALFKTAAGVTVANIHRINPSLSRDELDVSSHDSTGKWREFKPGLQGMEIAIEGRYIPTDSSHDDSATGLLNKFRNGTEENWTIVFNTSPTKTWTLPSFIRDLNVDAPFDSSLEFSMTLRLTGVPTFPA